MKKKIPIEKLLRWRFKKAGDKAPSAPTAARLLTFARPWWETSPERFQSAVRRLNSIQIAHTHPKSKSLQSRARDRVPALIVRSAVELETSVRVLSMNLNKGRMEFSFQCETEAEPDEQMFEATFVSESASKPLFCALAAKSQHNVYHLSATLSDDVAKEWERLKATDRMPFRLILRPLADPA